MTPSEQQIAELMLHWEQQWQAGEELSSELLCERHPELQEAVGREIRALKAMAWLSDVDSSPDGGSAEPDFQLSQVAALPETSLST
ncbi:MAG: hypothetical protein KDA79_23375, partial [Planctomycetaceae bacterium]|nr:hypothetical protein [Planctomycetaceae bacterium]